MNSRTKIEENLSFQNESFTGLLNEGIISKAHFNQLVMAIYELNQNNLSNEERFKIACQIWEISFRIQSLFTFDLDKNDDFIIQDLDSDIRNQVTDVLLYVSNFFTYGKKIEMATIFI